jgi:hypothetical protein
VRFAGFVTLLLLALPRAAAACASCITSPYGDRTYNVAYLGLILTPFVLALAVGAVFTRCWWTARRHAAEETSDPLLNEERT